jgi:hypothetical protein
LFLAVRKKDMTMGQRLPMLKTMGHSDPKTTAKYSASATPEQRAEIEKQVRLNQMVLDLEAEKGGRGGAKSGT